MEAKYIIFLTLVPLHCSSLLFFWWVRLIFYIKGLYTLTAKLKNHCNLMFVIFLQYWCSKRWWIWKAGEWWPHQSSCTDEVHEAGRKAPSVFVCRARHKSWRRSHNYGHSNWCKVIQFFCKISDLHKRNISN